MLQRQVTVAEVEREHLIDGLPFGSLNSDWIRLRGAIAAGDQLWLFAGCPLPQVAEPSGTCGSVGYALIRGCQVVDCIVVIVA